MRKKTLKIIVSLIITIMAISLIVVVSNKCFAVTDVTEDPSAWQPNHDIVSNKLRIKTAVILRIIRNIGIILSVLSLAAIALKIMFGSIEEKAKYKETLVPWVFGAFMVFSMTTIPSLIYNITYEASGTSAKVELTDFESQIDITSLECMSGHRMWKENLSDGKGINYYSNLLVRCHTGDCPDAHNVNYSTIVVRCVYCKQAMIDRVDYYECAKCKRRTKISYGYHLKEISYDSNKKVYNGLVATCPTKTESAYLYETTNGTFRFSHQNGICSCGCPTDQMNNIHLNPNSARVEEENVLSPFKVVKDKDEKYIKRIIFLSSKRPDIYYAGQDFVIIYGADIQKHSCQKSPRLIRNLLGRLYLCEDCGMLLVEKEN